MAKKQNKAQVTMPLATAAFAWIDKPDEGHKYSNGKYKITLVYDDEDVIKSVRHNKAKADLDEIIDALAKAEWGDEVDLDELKRPYKRPEDQSKEAFEGKLTMNASSKFQPMTRDAKRQPLPKGVKIMSGDVVSTVIALIPYESTEKVREGKKTVTLTTRGVSAQLCVVQLVEKRTGGGNYDDMLEEYEDGYDASTHTSNDQTEEDDASEEDDNGGDY